MKKLDPSKLRSKQIWVCVNSQELADIEARAARAGRSVSNFLRTAATLVDLSVPPVGIQNQL